MYLINLTIEIIIFQKYYGLFIIYHTILIIWSFYKICFTHKIVNILISVVR